MSRTNPHSLLRCLPNALNLGLAIGLTFGVTACDKSGDADKGAAAATGAAASTAATGAAVPAAPTGAVAATAATGAAAPTAATGAAAPTAATGAAAPTAATGAAAPTAATGAAAPTAEPAATDDEAAPSTKKKKKAPGPKADLAAGKDLFMKKCKSCHGANGDGQTKIGKKEEIPSMQKLKAPTSKVVSVITNGISGTKMKAYKSKLSAEEITNVAAFVKTL